MLISGTATRGLVALPRPAFSAANKSLPLRHCRPTPTPLRETSERLQFVCEAQAQSPDSSETSFVDYALGQGAYQLITGLCAVYSVGFIFAAPFAAEWMWGVKLFPAAECAFRSFGAALLIPAAMCYTLQSAVSENREDSPTYKRTAFAVALSFLVVCGFKFFRLSQGLVMSDFGVWFNTVFQILPAVTFVKIYGVSELQEIIPGFISGVKSLFQPENINAAFYSVLSVASMVLAGVAMIVPTSLASFVFTQDVDMLGQLVIQDYGALSFLLGIVLFTLKDAADKNRLGFITFKNLNIACAVAAVTKLGAAFYVTRQFGMSGVGGSPAAQLITRNGWIMQIVVYGALALLSGYNAVMAKKE